MLAKEITTDRPRARQRHRAAERLRVPAPLPAWSCATSACTWSTSRRPTAPTSTTSRSRCASGRCERGDRLRVGDTIFKYLSGSDIEVQYHEILFRMTVTDGLTNLCNRKQLDATLHEEIPRARRHGRELSVLMLDIDHFKSINDTHGHLAGDSVLRGLAAILQKRLRPNDRLGRYGGEEFCAILPETALANAAKIGEELRALVEAHAFVAEDKRINVTISIGAGCLRRRHGDRGPVPPRGRDALPGEAHGSKQGVSLRIAR